MDTIIKQALTSPLDISTHFVQKVEVVRQKVESRFAGPIYLNTDTNYASSYKLSIFLDQQGQPVSKGSESIRLEIAILISARADLFTIVQLNRTSKNEWSAGELTVASDTLVELVETIEETGYDLIQSDVLMELAPGCNTEMDGAPATVFQVLFSEMF